jgi:hypothetical protein
MNWAGNIHIKRLLSVFHRTHMTNPVVWIVFVFIGLTACTAHYPRSSPVSSFKSLENFSLKEKGYTERSEELLLLLTFSGGGTRAAAFSYGVLEAPADTWNAI